MSIKSKKNTQIKTKISDKKSSLKTSLKSSVKKRKMKPISVLKSSVSKSVVNEFKDKFLNGANLFANTLEESGKKIQKNGYIKVGSLIEKIGHRVKQP